MFSHSFHSIAVSDGNFISYFNLYNQPECFSEMIDLFSETKSFDLNNDQCSNVISFRIKVFETKVKQKIPVKAIERT